MLSLELVWQLKLLVVCFDTNADTLIKDEVFKIRIEMVTTMVETVVVIERAIGLIVIFL